MSYSFSSDKTPSHYVCPSHWWAVVVSQAFQSRTSEWYLVEPRAFVRVVVAERERHVSVVLDHQVVERLKIQKNTSVKKRTQTRAAAVQRTARLAHFKIDAVSKFSCLKAALTTEQEKKHANDIHNPPAVR